MQQEFFGAPVDAGVTVTQAEAKRAQREERAKTKDAKKGRGPDGGKKPVNGGGRIHSKRHQADLEFGGHRCHERQQCKRRLTLV